MLQLVLHSPLSYLHRQLYRIPFVVVDFQKFTDYFLQYGYTIIPESSAATISKDTKQVTKKFIEFIFFNYKDFFLMAIISQDVYRNIERAVIAATPAPTAWVPR